MALSDFEGRDYFDSRDVDERIDELEACVPDPDDGEIDTDNDPGLDEDEAAELAQLLAFRDDADTSEWRYGVTFILDLYFEEYARELAHDIGAIPDDTSWPLICIDWEQAANDLMMDYSSVQLGSSTYYYRA